MSTVINGRELADQMQAEIQKDVEKDDTTRHPTRISCFISWENPSQTYVRNKERSSQNWHSVKVENYQKLFQKKNYWLRQT